MPLTDIVPGITRMYRSRKEVAELTHITAGHITNLMHKGLFPAPDVWITSNHDGWDEERIIAFARAAQIIDKRGNKLHHPVYQRSAADVEELENLVRTKYRKRPRMYLGSSLIAALFQKQGPAIYTTRKRDEFIPADIVISMRFGWDEERVIAHGVRKETFAVPDRIDEWVLERTADYGLPAADWAVDRAIEIGPKRARALVAALEAACHPVPRRLSAAAA